MVSFNTKALLATTVSKLKLEKQKNLSISLRWHKEARLNKSSEGRLKLIFVF